MLEVLIDNKVSELFLATFFKFTALFAKIISPFVVFHFVA